MKVNRLTINSNIILEGAENQCRREPMVYSYDMTSVFHFGCHKAANTVFNIS